MTGKAPKAYAFGVFFDGRKQRAELLHTMHESVKKDRQMYAKPVKLYIRK